MEHKIENIHKDFYERIIDAQREAFKRGIVANSIIINENMCEVKPEWFRTDYGPAYQLPPMICGMNVYFTKHDLPENYSFAVLDSRPNRLAEFESIGMEPSELRKAAELYRKVKEIL